MQFMDPLERYTSANIKTFLMWYYILASKRRNSAESEMQVPTVFLRGASGFPAILALE